MSDVRRQRPYADSFVGHTKFQGREDFLLVAKQGNPNMAADPLSANCVEVDIGGSYVSNSTYLHMFKRSLVDRHMEAHASLVGQHMTIL